MSSSPRKKAPASATTLDPVATVLPCPECGEESLRQIQGDCTLLDGTVVQGLVRYHCTSCNADLFDRAAMREIRKQRAGRS
jgi:predicted RNA-binding Zn-ribbon protein involved in translation (DUF1610 family)